MTVNGNETALVEPGEDALERNRTAHWIVDPLQALLPSRPGDRIVDGKYRIVDTLGRGGMAEILKVEHLRLGKEFALKLMDPRLPEEAGPEDYQRVRQLFVREARLASRLNHAHIVQVVDFGVDPLLGGYLVMEYLVGETLHERLERRGPLPEPLALEIAIQVAEALHYMHEQEVIHGDIKAENVFLCRTSAERGRRISVKLIDFGLSRARVKGVTLATSEVSGSPHCMAPELIRGRSPQPSMDIYALGILLFEVLTGDLPFEGNVSELIIAHLKEEPPAPSTVLGRPLGERIEAFVLRLLRKDPAERPTSMGQVIYALRALLDLARPAGQRRHPSDPAPLLQGVDFQELADGCPFAVFQLDHDGQILYANRSFCGFERQRRREVVGQCVETTRLGRAYPELLGDLEQVAGRPDARRWHRRVQVEVGQERSVALLCWIVPVLDDQGRLVRFHGYLHPVGVMVE